MLGLLLVTSREPVGQQICNRPQALTSKQIWKPYQMEVGSQVANTFYNSFTQRTKSLDAQQAVDLQHLAITWQKTNGHLCIAPLNIPPYRV